MFGCVQNVHGARCVALYKGCSRQSGVFFACSSCCRGCHLQLGQLFATFDAVLAIMNVVVLWMQKGSPFDANEDQMAVQIVYCVLARTLWPSAQVLESPVRSVSACAHASSAAAHFTVAVACWMVLLRITHEGAHWQTHTYLPGIVWLPGGVCKHWWHNAQSSARVRC